MSKSPVLSLENAVVERSMKNGEHFESQLSPLAEKLGASLLGANLTRVPPGKAAFPFHHHYALEEHFFIVRGKGVLRFGAEQYPVKAGDYIVAPRGGPETAHQLINTGTSTLAYLAISNRTSPEVVGYPDSQKMGVAAMPYGSTEGLGRFLVADAERDFEGYWKGEDGTAVAAILSKKDP